MKNSINTERYWSKVDKTPDAVSCWNWTAAKWSKGYGMFRIGSRRVSAHKVSVILDGREIPDGMCVDHLCKNTSCVNPAHLEVVSPTENTRRGNRTKLDVERIREIRVSSNTSDKLAAIYGVSVSTIQRIRGFRLWKGI